MDIQSIITYIMEMLGTVAFAASGAMVGISKKMDIFGVCVLGFVTACGGGMVLRGTAGFAYTAGDRLYPASRYIRKLRK